VKGNLLIFKREEILYRRNLRYYYYTKTFYNRTKSNSFCLSSVILINSQPSTSPFSNRERALSQLVSCIFIGIPISLDNSLTISTTRPLGLPLLSRYSNGGRFLSPTNKITGPSLEAVREGYNSKMIKEYC